MSEDKPISTQEFIDSLNEMLGPMGFKPIPSVSEMKQAIELKNQKAQSRNERIVKAAVGKEMRVRVEKNVVVRGIIVEAELNSFGQAKVVLECGPNKVRRGPYFVSKLPR